MRPLSSAQMGGRNSSRKKSAIKSLNKPYLVNEIGKGNIPTTNIQVKSDAF